MPQTHRCPHCDAERSVLVPRTRTAILVATCPDCGEMSLLFDGIVLGLRRAVFESGNREAITHHVAEIVGQLLDLGIEVVQPAPAPRRRPRRPAREIELDAEEPAVSGISEDDMEHFRRFELTRIDEREYFRKHFG